MLDDEAGDDGYQGRDGYQARLPGSFPITWGPNDHSTMEKLKVREVNIPIHERTATADLGLELRPLSPGALNPHFQVQELRPGTGK